LFGTYDVYGERAWANYEFHLDLTWGQAYRVRVRAVDVFGYETPWAGTTGYFDHSADRSPAFTCTPFVLPMLGYDVVSLVPGSWAGDCLGASAAVPRAYDLAPLGAPPGPVELVATGLLPWAFLSGTTLHVEPTADLAVGTWAQLEVTATSGAYTTSERYCVAVTQ
jgi:hypothetical protein